MRAYRRAAPAVALLLIVAAVPVLAFGLLLNGGHSAATQRVEGVASVPTSPAATAAPFAVATTSDAQASGLELALLPSPVAPVPPVVAPGSPVVPPSGGVVPPSSGIVPPSAAPDPVVAAAGDIACDPGDATLRANGLGAPSGTSCEQMLTARQLVAGNYAAVLPLGDDQYYCGSLAAYERVYDASWGQVKAVTHPVPGNHEYITSRGTVAATECNDSNDGAAGYFGYFGPAAGQMGQGWYSYHVGAWHLIALNSQCSAIDGCGRTSPEGTWLAADLAANPGRCIMAYWHVPLFSSGGRAALDTFPLWQQLYAAHADVILSGHDHIYERFAPQTPTGLPDPIGGITEFIVGTGGSNHTKIARVAANSVVRDTTSFGVLAMTLHPGGMDWQFLAATGHFTDSGSLVCHAAM